MTALAARARERLLDLLDQPILVKELRAALRRRRFVVLFTTALALVGLLLVGGLTLGSGLGPEAQDPSRVGRLAFLAFLAAEAAVVFLVFPAATCTSIIDEQASGTLDLLVTTRLRPGQVVLGKLLAGVVYGLLLVVSTLPLVAITFLYGGVAPWQIALSYAALAMCGVVVASYGLLVSSLSQTTARAVVRTFLALPFVSLLVLSPVVAVVNDLVVAPLQRPSHAPSLLALPAPALVLGGLAMLAWPLAWSSLFLLLATDRLRPELDDRDGPRRRWTLATVGTALALFVAWRLATPWSGSVDALAAFQALALSSMVVALATVALVTVAPRRPGEAPASGWRALLRPGLDGGADLVLALALVLGVTLFAVHTTPGADGARGATLTRVPVIRDAGVAWLLAASLALVQGHRLLAAGLRRLVQSPLGPRLVTVGVLAVAMGLAGPWVYKAARDPRDSAWPGAVLSPFVAGASVITEPSFYARSTVLGPSSQVVDRLLERVDKALLVAHPAPTAADGGAARLNAHTAWRSARREEQARELLADDLPLHVASTGLLLGLGLLLSGWRWALARRARSTPA